MAMHSKTEVLMFFASSLDLVFSPLYMYGRGKVKFGVYSRFKLTTILPMWKRKLLALQVIVCIFVLHASLC